MSARGLLDLRAARWTHCHRAQEAATLCRLNGFYTHGRHYIHGNSRPIHTHTRAHYAFWLSHGVLNKESNQDKGETTGDQTQQQASYGSDSETRF